MLEVVQELGQALMLELELEPGIVLAVVWPLEPASQLGCMPLQIASAHLKSTVAPASSEQQGAEC